MSNLLSDDESEKLNTIIIIVIISGVLIVGLILQEGRLLLKKLRIIVNKNEYSCTRFYCFMICL